MTQSSPGGEEGGGGKGRGKAMTFIYCFFLASVKMHSIGCGTVGISRLCYSAPPGSCRGGFWSGPELGAGTSEAVPWEMNRRPDQSRPWLWDVGQVWPRSSIEHVAEGWGLCGTE